jgi:hypothetical protein
MKFMDRSFGEEARDSEEGISLLHTPDTALCSGSCVAFTRFRDGLVGWHIERLARRLEAFEKERA